VDSADVLELEDLGKDYGERAAVKSVSLRVHAGEVFGLLGPNGAGKTTTISMACGVFAPSRGRVRVAGHDVQTETFAAKRAIGLVPQDLALYDELTPRQNLAFFGSLYGLGGQLLARRIDRALTVSGLTDRSNELVKTFSGGMKRRLNLVVGLLHEPKLLVLDEPTVGVDPQSRNHIFDAVRALRAQGTSVLYTSHYMNEVEELCDRIAIMDAGAVIASGTLDELSANDRGTPQLELGGELAQLDAAEAALVPFGGKRTGHVVAFERERIDSWGPIVAAVEGAGARVVRLGAKTADLETVFLALTGKGLRDA
jgi:ABC-2 type transport system ATP-binding protein